MMLIFQQDVFDNRIRQTHANDQSWVDTSFQSFDLGEENNYSF